MITDKQYFEAKKVIEDYNEQVRIANVIRDKYQRQRALKREQECDEHYYLPDGKWTSTRSCTFCGKTIQ